MQQILELLDVQELATTTLGYAPKLFAAFVILFIFWTLSRLTRPAIRKALQTAEFQGELIKLLVDNVYRFTILGLGVMMAASQVGIDVGAALAGFGVAGIAVGFAAQDSIANTIAGFLIFWDKPFEVGQIVETQDQYGEVREITMRTTRIRTPDNTYVVVPNRKIIEDVMVNRSMYGETRLRVPIGIAYKEDVAEARKVLLDAVSDLEDVATDPEPEVVVTELGSSNVRLEVRAWVADAGIEKPIFARALEASKAALNRAGIEIPFPHLQLHVDGVKEPVFERIEQLPALARSAGES